MQKKSFSGHKSMTLKTNISTSLTAPYRFFSYGVKIKSCLNKKRKLWKTLSSFSSCYTDYFTSCNQDFLKTIKVFLHMYLFPLNFVLDVYYWSKPDQLLLSCCWYELGLIAIKMIKMRNIQNIWNMYQKTENYFTLKGKNNLDVLNVWNLTHSWLK